MKIIRVTAIILLCAGCVLLGYCLGCLNVRNQASREPMRSETFYASITTINENEFVVEGLEVNDVNHRGTMVISADENTAYEWRYTAIAREELEAGDTISITYTGTVAECYPPIYSGIERVQLLDDDK